MTDRRERFRALHVPGRPVVLANAWDAGTARLAEAFGMSAVATTSTGVSWSHGVPDGRCLSRADALAALGRIAAAVDLPVSGDIEDGYGDTPDDVAATVTAVSALGVAGINIEDAWHGGAQPLRTIPDQQARLAALRSADPTLFVNARIDTYLNGVTDPDVSVRRADAYLEAGADGIFLPGVSDPHTVASLVSRIDAPVNIMIGTAEPAVAQLADAGVARISLGAALAIASYHCLARAISAVTGGEPALDSPLAEQMHLYGV